MNPTVAIIGAGAGGIAMGIQLAGGGYDFTIFDRADGFGGTWRHNTFPGAACDVPSHLYSFSFALNPRWSKTYANQPEILEYLQKVAADHGLHGHLRANTVVESVRWSDEHRRWTLMTAGGAAHNFDMVVSAVGMLDVPNIPAIPGAHRFGGRAFHSSRWDHRRSTAGQRVASIGTGASAIQYVPAIAPETAALTVFQRTPIWVSPRHDVPFTPEQHELFERDPAAAIALRDQIFDSYETSSFDADAAQTHDATELARSYLMRKVPDPRLRDKLTPDYPVGCKRPLMSRDWFPTFALPHVHLETSPIVEFTERGLRTADGAEHMVDTVIYGTGFRAADYLSSIDVYGTGGRRLHDEWAAGPEAYLGTLVTGYPNFFMLYGPNTNGVNSILYIHEVQTAFIRHILDTMAAGRARTVEVTGAAQHRYNAEIQAAMAGKVWLANCNSYYRHPSGKVVTQLPYSGKTFAERTRRIDPADYHLRT
jgi:cation diffusion facilitator CzcD-associated flavoprotein CzcO